MPAYPAVARHVAELMARPELQPAGAPAPVLVVDATGVGRPVVDLLDAHGLSPIAITITGGNVAESGRVPKRDLVATLSVALQTGQLKIAEALSEAATLVRELLAFRVKIDPLTAHDSYGAWREGAHDDLVLAAALAVWWARLPATVVTYAPAGDFLHVSW